MNLLSWAWDNLFQISLIVSPVATVCVLAFWTQVASRAELKRVERKGDAVEQRVRAVEQQLRTLATKGDIQEVLLALARQDGKREALDAKLDGVAQRVQGMERPLDIIQEHLLRESRR